MKKTCEEMYSRFEVDNSLGLFDHQVEIRNKEKLTNKSRVKVAKSYFEIIFTDLFSFFNVLLFLIASLMIYAEHYDGLFFLVVLIPNIVITLYEDIHARVLLGKLNMASQPKVTLLRNGVENTYNSDDIVLDDLIHYKGNQQITADGILVSGVLYVNEALITGESLPIKKECGDFIYRGSYTVSGDALVKAEAVGKNCYIEKIHEKANKFKRTPSEIKSSMKKLFLGIGIIVVSIGICMCIVYFVQGKFSSPDLIKKAISDSISGSMVAMIPSGMYLLTSAVFSLSVINLSKKNAQIQDFYSIEMLSKINVLCVDKTGTITDGTLSFKKIVILNSGYQEEDIKSLVLTIQEATKDNNITSNALKKAFNNSKILSVEQSVAFSSETKKSAIRLANGKTVILGASEFMDLVNEDRTNNIIRDYSEKGLRVLTIATNDQPIIEEKVTGRFEAIAIIVLEDHVKEDASETFKWFNENGVQIKVISGDNAISVSYIAQEAGILNADKYVSLENKTLAEVAQIADSYTVFGRVSPEQKEAIITALKAKEKKVAMTGDGVNDILALKRSDCSIAMANGSDAARNVSNIVLLDSNFHSLPRVVSEGRRIVNNLQRTCSLFLVKTMFAMFFSIFFLMLSLIKNDPTISYPYLTNHLYLWEIFSIGMSGFFISLEKNENKFKGKFLKNIFSVSIPAGSVLILMVLTFFIFGFIKDNGGYDFGIMNSSSLVAMTTVAFTLYSLFVLYRVCEPLNKYRGIVFFSATGLTIVLSILAVIFSYLNGSSDKTILRIPFESMNGVSWFITSIVTSIFVAIYILLTYILKVLKGGNKL